MADRDAEDTRPAAPGEAPPALTVAELRDLIREHALTGPKGNRTSLRMPDDEALAELAGIVNHWAEQVRQAQTEAEFHKAYREADDAAATLRKVLPIIGARLVAQANRGDPIARERLLPPARHLFDAAMSFVAPPPPAWRAEGVRDKPVPDWRHFAGVLLADLEKAFDTKLGRHDDGPAARLLAMLLRHVTGETITTARIGKVLRSIKS
jgi:hypothetical protein